MMRYNKRTGLLLILLVVAGMLLLGACSSQTTGDPVTTVQQYMTAKADGDGETIRQLLCTEMEGVVEREIRTFESVSDVRIEGMACQRAGDGSVVSCTGRIVASYGAEETEFPLGSYRVVEEDGMWKWCGEAAP